MGISEIVWTILGETMLLNKKWMLIKKHWIILNSNYEEIYNMASDNSNGLRIYRSYICANHVYGEYGENAQRAILRGRKA